MDQISIQTIDPASTERRLPRAYSSSRSSRCGDDYLLQRRSYASETKFLAEFQHLVDQITAHRDLPSGLGMETTFNNLFAAFRYAVICTKHPAFYEEREWRVVYQPNFQASDRLVEDTVVLGGVPQRIFKIPLQDYPSEGFYGAEIAEFLHRLIIGPGAGADAVKREFIRLLATTGVENADTKVIVSDVPLRA